MILHLKKVAKIYIRLIFSVLMFATFVFTAISLYQYGFLQGLNYAQETTDKQIAYLLENYKVTMTPTPTKIEPTPTVKITAKISSPPANAYYKDADWGGPELWKAVNDKRAEYGVNPLNQRDELCTIASIRLNELLELGKLDGHEGFSNMEERRPDLSWIFENYSTMAEFLAVGGKTPEETVNLWEGTLGHKKLLTGGEYVWGCIYAQNTFAVAITAF